MLLNLASIKPFIYDDSEFIFFDRKNLEQQLPEFFANKLPEEIYVITGPGYFSSTRIGVEVVNILSFLKKVRKIYFMDKISLFKQFVVDVEAKKNNLGWLGEYNENQIVSSNWENPLNSSIWPMVLFSGNKSKHILLSAENIGKSYNADESFCFVSQNDMDKYWKVDYEEWMNVFGINWKEISYKDVLKNYKKFTWQTAKYIKPYYVFEPIVW